MTTSQNTDAVGGKCACKSVYFKQSFGDGTENTASTDGIEHSQTLIKDQMIHDRRAADIACG